MGITRDKSTEIVGFGGPSCKTKDFGHLEFSLLLHSFSYLASSVSTFGANHFRCRISEREGKGLVIVWGFRGLEDSS